MRLREDAAALALPEIPLERPSGPRAKKAGPRCDDKRFAGAVLETTRMMRTQDWTGIRPTNFVAMYAILYRGVYKVDPDLTPTERGVAACCAGRQLRAEFHGNVASMIAYMRWVWAREARREEERAHNGDSFTISPRYLFGPKMVREWRVSQARAQVWR